jgi:hypothetical protein
MSAGLIRAAGVAGAAFIASFWAMPEGTAHSFYEYRCCSDRDCQPIDFDEVQVTPRGYIIRTSGVLIPFGDQRIRPTPIEDELQRYHLCTTSGKKAGPVLCLYVPQGGV